MVTVYYYQNDSLADIFEDGKDFWEEGSFLKISNSRGRLIAAVNIGLVKKVIVDEGSGSQETAEREASMRPLPRLTATGLCTGGMSSVQTHLEEGGGRVGVEVASLR